MSTMEKRILIVLAAIHILLICQPASAAPVRRLARWNISWTFDRDYDAGTFANGDPWVAGPVTIVGIDPPSVSGARVMNGSMMNPDPRTGRQGYDSAMAYNEYDPALNVALDVSPSKPLILPAGASLVSAISAPQASSLPQLERAAILTVLSAVPPEGSFRPPYCGTDKTVRFSKSALNYSLLQKLAPAAGTPALAEVADYFAAPWLDHQSGWVGRYQHPAGNMPDYGRDMFTRIGVGALMLHLDFPPAEKETLLIRYVQLGIDLYGVAVQGGQWWGEGGHGGGRKWPILFAGLMLKDAAMQKLVAAQTTVFGEDGQTFYVSQADIDVTHSPAWQPESRDAQKIPYEAKDIGLAEWAIRHDTHPQQSNAWFPTLYRYVACPPYHAVALAACLTPGAKAAWAHDAFFDYTDRYMRLTAPGAEFAGWWRSMSPFTEAMWDAYHVLPALPALPPLPDPARCLMPRDGGTRYGTMTDLRWEGNGAKYQLLFGTTVPGPGQAPVWEGAETSYDPGMLACDTTYYWRVDSLNEAGGIAGQVWQFRTRAGVPAPATVAP